MKNGEDNDRLLNDEYDEWQKIRDERDREDSGVFGFVCFVFVLILIYYRSQI